MKNTVTLFHILMAASLLFEVQPSAFTQVTKNLRSNKSSSEVIYPEDDDFQQDDDSEQEDRSLITYHFSGSSSTRYYNSSYTRTKYKSHYNYNDDGDYHFHYNRTDSSSFGHYYEDEDGEEDDTSNKPFENTDEYDRYIPNDGSIRSEVLKLMSEAENMFAINPREWSGTQWGIFSAVFGGLIALLALCACCCLHSAKSIDKLSDTAAADDDNETDTDYDDLNDEETNATPTLDQETKDYMAYVQLPASGTEKK